MEDEFVQFVSLNDMDMAYTSADLWFVSNEV